MSEQKQHGGGAPLVVLEHVEKHFGDLHVLRDVNLTVARGEVVVVIGPSGSGKSTLCRTINRLETVDSGTITVDGEPLPSEGKALAGLRAEVGMVFQSFNLFAHKTILENVTLGPVKVRKQTQEQAEATARRLLDRVGVGEQADKLPAQLSGGQQQRVAIARALAQEAAVILADEPVASLDPDSAATVLQTLRSIAGSGVAVVASLHQVHLAMAYADRIVALRDGRVFQDAPVAEIDARAIEQIYGSRGEAA